MGDGDDLDVVETFTENDRERVPVKDHATGSVQVWRAHQWVHLESSIGVSKFFIEAKSGIWTPLIQ